MTPEEILTLAKLYAAHCRCSLSTAGVLACGNNLVFRNLARGNGADIKTVMRAAAWFEQNWPEGLRWPASVRRLPRHARTSW